MKNIVNNIKKAMVPLLGVMMLTSCGDETDFAPYATKDIQEQANVKFLHSAVGPNGTNFTINYFMGAEKISSVGVTGGLPLGIGFGSQYPSPINYALITPGDQPLSAITPATASAPANTVLTGKIVTEKGKYYTNFLLATPPTVTPAVYSFFQINDDLSVVDQDPTKAYIRFINVISNTPAAGFDLGIIKTTSANGAAVTTTSEIKTYRNVVFKGGEEKFVAIEPQDPIDNRAYQIQLRRAGSPVNVPGTITGTTIANVTNASGNFTPRAGRVYTVYCRGIDGGLPNATTNIASVTWITNK